MTTTTIDKGGRVVIPKALREELNLEPGDAVEIATDGEQVTLRPVRAGSRLRKERGVWVFHGGPRLTAREVRRRIEVEREERQRRISGELG